MEFKIEKDNFLMQELAHRICFLSETRKLFQSKLSKIMAAWSHFYTVHCSVSLIISFTTLCCDDKKLKI